MLTLVALVALAVFALGVSGVVGKDTLSLVDVDLGKSRMPLELATLVAVGGGLALMIWLATNTLARRHTAHLLRLITGLNLSVLMLNGVFEGLVYSSESTEKNNLIRGLLVVAALTWEITASGPITNIATRYLPRPSRLLLFLAYAMLVAVTVFLFFTTFRLRTSYIKGFNPDDFILVGLVLLGIPIIFAASITRVAALLSRGR